MGLREILTGQPKEFPVDAAPGRVDFAETRILELVTDEIKQAFVDMRHQIDLAQSNGGPGEGDLGRIQTAFLMSNILTIVSFVDGLKGSDRKLLDILPSKRKIDPVLQEALTKGGVSVRKSHHHGAVITLLEKHAARRQPSLETVSISRLTG